MATSDSHPEYGVYVPDVTLAVARGAGSGGGGGDVGTGVAPNILFDGFESADMSAPDGPTPALNRDSFIWGGNNRTSVVTMNEAGNPEVVYNNGVISNEVVGSTRDWTAISGDYSLRFRYAGNTSDPIAEQEFSLGATIYPEIWISFWLRVPNNFFHFGGFAERNHKIFRLWQGDGRSEYSIIGQKFGMEFRGDGNGNSNFYIWPGSGSGDAIGNGGNAPFIDISTDRGRWMNLIVQGRIESSPGADDGLMRAWRKWEDESSYTQTHERLNTGFQRSSAVGKEGFTEGYLMGFHNGGYEEDTEWLIDDFKLSTTSLLPE